MLASLFLLCNICNNGLFTAQAQVVEAKEVVEEGDVETQPMSSSNSDAPTRSKVTPPPSSKAANRRNTYVKQKEGVGGEPLVKPKPDTILAIFKKAGKRALGGGIPGAAAGLIQVVTLMWLRTIMNYQYRYGTGTISAIRTLYAQGGIKRFYKGIQFAVIQGPLSRFGSTAANDGVNALLASLPFTANWGAARGTFIASILVGVWRILLMPIDTCKTVLQVDSTAGFRSLIRKVKAGNVGVLYQGAIANYFSAIVGHYPWFFTYNFLTKAEWVTRSISSKLLRNAFVGFTASLISDCVANFMRVIKTTKQSIATKHSVSYSEAIGMIVAADGWRGLFGRGLRTRIIANGFQSVVFTIVWRGLSDLLNNRAKEGEGGEEEEEEK